MKKSKCMSAAELFKPGDGPGTLVVSDQLRCHPRSKPWAAVVKGSCGLTVLYRTTRDETFRDGCELRVGVR